MPRSNLEYSGGGCALNTARVFQWLSPTPSSAVFLGGLGKVGLFPLLKPSRSRLQDDSGAVLESLVNSDAVLTAFAKQVSGRQADCPAVSLDLCIYTTNKYPNVKQLSWAIN